jgi:ABC-type phosphate transport system substrate-binding protein
MRTLIALFALAGSLVAADTVVVNSASALAGISADQFKDIYLGRKTAWDDGSKIIVVLVEAGDSNDALMKILGKSQSQFITSWKKLVFTGKGIMPDMVKDDAAVVEAVAKTPGAIGFVTAEGPAGVKVVPLQ